MAADVVELAEGIKAAIVAGFAVAPPVTASIQRVWKNEFEVETFEGLRVDIWAIPYRDAGDITREEYELEAIIIIVIADRYLPAGATPDGWVDDRVDIVQRRVFEPIEAIPQESIIGFRFTDVKVTTLCDVEFLREHKVFWSEVQVTARRIKT